MWSILLFPAFAAPFEAPAPASAESMIRDQLEAFRRGDVESAWSPLAPGLRAKFGTPERFFDLVRRGYAPMLDVQQLRFGDPAFHDGGPARWIHFQDRSGRAYRALYLLEQQPDGTWRTSGCLLMDEVKIHVGV